MSFLQHAAELATGATIYCKEYEGGNGFNFHEPIWTKVYVPDSSRTVR